MPASFLAGYPGSKINKEPEAAIKYDDEKVRTHLEVGHFKTYFEFLR